MRWHLNSLSFSSIDDICPAVTQHINVFTSQQTSDLLVMVSLLEILALICIIICQIQDIVSSPSFIGVCQLILFSHFLNSTRVSRLLILHEFPTLEIPFVLLNSEKNCKVD
jgi:hypothetical protein